MNPELRRNLWLELSLHRMLAMPGVLALALVFVYVQARDTPAALVGTANGLFVVLVHVWGSRQASESVTEEMRDRTWDWQRLSSLGPWSMTWGKLAGATAFQWYGAVICLAALLVAAQFASTREPLWTVLTLVASGVATHGLVFATSLQAMRNDPKIGNRMGGIVLLPLLVVGLVFSSALGREQDTGVQWYGYEIATMRFAALSACAFAGWAVLGAYREMSRELRVITTPWAFPAFTIFSTIYVAGFLRAPHDGMAFPLVGFVVGAVTFFYALFAEVTTAMSLRRLAVYVARRDWRRAADAVPLWLPAALLVLAFAIASMPMPIAARGGQVTAPAGFLVLATGLLALRDVGILVFFALSPRARRIQAATFFYLVLLYWIIPGVLMAWNLPFVAGFFLPPLLDGIAALVATVLQLAVVWGLAAWRWRRMQESFERG